jgi:hypothetical protein
MYAQTCPIRTRLGVISLAEVRLQEGESLENALRRFKCKVQTEDIIKEVKRHFQRVSISGSACPVPPASAPLAASPDRLRASVAALPPYLR